MDLGTTNRARISTKKIKIKTPKEQKPTMSKYKGTSQGKIVHEKLATLRGDDLSTVKPPSTPTETSSSEEETSSEEESEYEEDEDMPVQHISSVRFPSFSKEFIRLCNSAAQICFSDYVLYLLSVKSTTT
jgi:hypothetical protein